MLRVIHRVSKITMTITALYYRYLNTFKFVLLRHQFEINSVVYVVRFQNNVFYMTFWCATYFTAVQMVIYYHDNTI